MASHKISRPGVTPVDHHLRFRRFPREAVNVVKMMLMAGKTMLLRALRRSDYKRWTNPRSLEGWWEPRTEKIARLIPNSSRVIEFGAGSRKLEKYLDPTCTYVPSDLVDRGPGTIILDLNKRPLPDLGSLAVTVAVFVGVLEYLSDLQLVAHWLSGQVAFCVVSYTCAKPSGWVLQRFREVLERAHFGYMNHYTQEELMLIFKSSGFSCLKKDEWRDQDLFLFEREELEDAQSRLTKYPRI